MKGFVSRIYWRILRKSETRPRADMFTLLSPRKKVKEASTMLPFSAAVHEVAGRCLVLVFAATRRHLALRAAGVSERAGRHVEFFEMRFVKALYTV